MVEADTVAHNAEFLKNNLRSIVPPGRWVRWFSEVGLEIEKHTLRVVLPSDFHLQWVQSRYRDLIESLAFDHLGDGVVVEYTVGTPTLMDSSAPAALPASPTDAHPRPAGPSPDATAGDSSRFEWKYRFDMFVAGPSNELALASAKAVSEYPGQQYNPLFLFGRAGLGKTHLLHAIGHRIHSLRPDSAVRYTNSENFFNEFINGIRRKQMDLFKQRYRSIDVLLLDDIQFFEGKEQVLEEVFHTFNTLHDLDKQIVLSCDRPAKDLGMEDRLISRIQWGLVADLHPPPVETRLAILRRNAEYAPSPVPPEVIDLIAHHITDNIRELEGALTRVTAYAGFTNQPITLDLARDQLRDLIPTTSGRPPTGPEIVALTAASYGLSVSDLEGPSRRGPTVKARHVAMYLCRSLTDLSLQKIGKLFGGRDHSTASHAVNKVTKLMQSDPAMARRITQLREELGAG